LDRKRTEARWTQTSTIGSTEFHNHLYERIYSIRNNVVQAEVPPDGTIDPVRDGTTYICTGGGGLAASATSGWHGTSAGGTGAPLIEVRVARRPSGDHGADLRSRLPEIMDAVGHRQCFTVSQDGHQVSYWLTRITEKFVRCPMAFR
jgi:hypothetical protein